MASNASEHPPKHHRPMLFGILLLAAALRLSLLDQVPNGFYSDEVAIGYDAYSLLKTGRDHWGDAWPLFAKSFGDYDEALYRYLTIPAIYLFGLTEFSTRLTAAIAGILTVWAVYHLSRRLFGPQQALCIALFLAISPWHIQFSRWAVRAILLPLFFCLALSTFLKGLKDPRYRLWSALLFGISLHTYNSARVFIPLFLIGLVFFYHRQLRQHRRWTLGAAVLFLSIFGYLFTFWISPEGMQRADTTLTRDVGALPEQYLSYLNPRFLFWRGDNNIRHSLSPMGQLHYVECIFVFAGLYGLIRRRPQGHRIIWLWLFLYPIPAALTASTHAIRSIVGAPLFAVFSGYGLHFIFTQLQTRKRQIAYSAVCAIAIASSVAVYAKFYFIDYAKYSAYWWKYGIKEALELSEQTPYPCIVAEPQPFYAPTYIYVLFYTRYPPDQYHALSDAYKAENWIDTPRPLGKYYITDNPEPIMDNGPCVLFVGPKIQDRILKTNYELYTLHSVLDPGGRGILFQVWFSTGKKKPS